MDYILTFEDGSDAYLFHHGIKGMKWGVRNAETLAKYGQGGGAKPSKREVKRAIKESRKAYAKQNGKRFAFGQEVGANTAAVAKKHKNYMDNDQEYAKLKKNHERASDKRNIADDRLSVAKDYKDRVDADGDPFKRLTAQRELKKAQEHHDQVEKEYFRTNDKLDAHVTNTAKKFSEQYRTAAAKDIGFKDVNAGKKLLDEYGLMNKATRASRFDGLRRAK